MKKVLFIIHNSLNKGGIQNVIMNIVRSLGNEYCFDGLVFSEEKGYYDDEFISFGGKLIKKQFNFKLFDLRKINFYIRGYFIYKIIKKTILLHGPYTVIHCHIADESGIALWVAYRNGIPIRIVHSHIAFERKYNLIAKIYTYLLQKMVFKYATNMVGCSKIACENLFKNHRYEVIYNTIDKKFFYSIVNHNIRTQPYLLQVGTFSKNKNQLFSIEVLKYLKEYYPGSHLIFIGSYKNQEMELYFKELQRIVMINNLNDSVKFLPSDIDVVNEMNEADYLLFPSQYEGLGIVPIEAQSMGMKCFVSDSVPHDINCGGCIFLSLSKGAKEWANYIYKQFTYDNGKREKYDMTKFSNDIIMSQYRKLYNGEMI